MGLEAIRDWLRAGDIRVVEKGDTDFQYPYCIITHDGYTVDESLRVLERAQVYVLATNKDDVDPDFYVAEIVKPIILRLRRMTQWLPTSSTPVRELSDNLKGTREKVYGAVISMSEI